MSMSSRDCKAIRPNTIRLSLFPRRREGRSGETEAAEAEAEQAAAGPKPGRYSGV